MDNTSLVGTTSLDASKLVSVTNRAQAIVIALANDHLVPEEARKHYEAANDAMRKAMRAVLNRSR